MTQTKQVSMWTNHTDQKIATSKIQGSQRIVFLEGFIARGINDPFSQT